jgi:hypothetical protein
MLAPDFRRAVHNQVEVYHRVGARYAVIGGLAVGAYSEPRATSDVDFLADDNVFDRSASRLIDCFKAGVPISYAGIRIDTLAPDKDEYESVYLDAIDSAIESDEPAVRIVTAEHLAFMKLHAFRSKDRADLAAMLEAGTIDLAQLRELIDGFDALEENFDKIWRMMLR